MWELDYKESWEPENWFLEIAVWRRVLSVPWTARRSNQLIIKKSTLNIHWKDWCRNWSSNTLATWCKELTHQKMSGKDWMQEEKGTTEDEMVGWHHRLEGHQFEQALGVGDGQGSLVCCSPWVHKKSDTTERLNWTERQPTPVLLPGKYHGRRSLVGYSPWGHEELDSAEWLSTHTFRNICLDPCHEPEVQCETTTTLTSLATALVSMIEWQ